MQQKTMRVVLSKGRPESENTPEPEIEEVTWVGHWEG